jgi:nitroimidazol reductase NimA-like FMN-containing flavoprotein (pyridoxamine 5'-phosphate oxidase superfamily)
VGRVAFQTDNGLRIFPVNYVVHHDDRIVFRTLPHGVLARSVRGADVAFEVDDLDEELHAGWSVLAVGRCERIEDAGELTEVRTTGAPTPWVDGTRHLHFAVRWKGLSGRRLGDA